MVRNVKLSPTGEVDSYPLSPMQQGMLFHRLGGGDPGVDVEQVVCELHEEINAAIFDQAWREVVRRHAPLRTSFEWNDGEPRQVVYPPTRVTLALHHADFGSEGEARRGLQEYLLADRREGFPELTAPLLRVALLRGGPAHFWFVTTYHHLLLDARSMTIVFREVMELHDAMVQGRQLRLPQSHPYRRYIEWLQRHDLRRAETFWREQLRGFTSPTELPIPRTREATEGEAVDELAFRLPDGRTTALRAVARKHGVTLNTLVQAAWSIVLSRYSGDDDVVFGAVRAGRRIPVEGADAMVGVLINTVPVRVRLAASAPIGALLRQLREQWMAMRDYEHTPLMRIQQWSDVAPGRPLFETLLSFQEPAWDAALRALGGVWARRSFDIRAQPGVPLALEVLAGAGLVVKLIHDPRRFAAEAMARMMGHIRVVLEALADDTADTVGALPLLTREEHEQFRRWNDTAADYPRECGVHSLVAAHAARRPDAIAVSDPSNLLSYGELNRRADQLAQKLRARGVGRESLVAVCMERSTEMIVAWLGVLKAGGAFVPLDPAYPEERIAFQLEDCGAAVLLAQPDVRSRLPSLPDRIAVLELPPGGAGFGDEPGAVPPADATARDLAYVIYTSGSTGQPKGVAVEHRALMNLVSWHQRTYSVTPADRATQLASPAFDASVWEIWPYLAAGGSIHIPDEETRLSPTKLWRWMAREGITMAFMPTPLAEAAMNDPCAEPLALRAVLTGGDKLTRPPSAGFPCPLINHYGPTESTVVATSGLVDPQARAGAVPSIGKPIANTEVFVLDRNRRLLPAGVPGELFIGGESLARGYLRRPGLTAEKFVDHPYDLRPGARLYRTGDLVRWTDDGVLEFLGRLDGQVKIRGCRIEPGEIEAAMQRHPAVRDCVVQTRREERGEAQLVAYMIPAAGVKDGAGDVAGFLRSKLPAWMVPSAIVSLDAWPLTPNGKIDRQALPIVAAASSGTSPGSTAPLTPAEESVGRVWSEVLRRPVVARDGNFFELGGHSLLAAQVVSRLNAMWRGAISVRVLFDHPTLAGFARAVEERLGPNTAPRALLPCMTRRSRRSKLELVAPN